MTASDPSKSPPQGEQLIIRLPGQASDWKEIGLWAGVLALLVLVAFFPATSGTALVYDRGWVQYTPVPGSISAVWSDRAPMPAYQPMAFTVYWLEYHLQGKSSTGEPIVTGFHLGALILHAVAVVLLWLILRDLRVPGSWLAAAVFAVHPINTEAVSWISSQDVVLAGAAGFGAIYCWMWFAKFRDRDALERADGKPGVDPAITWGQYAGGFLLAVMSVLSHPVGVIFPVMGLFALGWRRKLRSNDVLLLVIPGIAAAILWGIEASKSSFNPSVGQITGVCGYGFLNAVRDVWIPFGLTAFHPSPPSMTAGIVVALAVFVPLLAVGIAYGVMRSGGVAAGAVGFGLAVVFGLNWFDTRFSGAVSDSANYVSSAFLITMAVALIASLVPPMKQSMSAAMAVAMLILLVLLITARNRTDAFQSNLNFWADVESKDPNSTVSQALLAEELRLKGAREFAEGSPDAGGSDTRKAVEHARRAVELNPKNGDAERTWANALVGQGKVGESLPHYQAAVLVERKNVRLLLEWASALLTIKRNDDAAKVLNAAVNLSPRDEEPHRLLGQACLAAGDSKRAIIEERIALETAPDDSMARQILAEALAKSGDINGALAEYQNLGESRVKRPEIYAETAQILDQLGRYREEMIALRIAAKMDPNPDQYKSLFEAAQKHATTEPTTMPSTQPAATQPAAATPAATQPATKQSGRT